MKTKNKVVGKIRTSFNRDSSLDESKIQKLKNKKSRPKKNPDKNNVSQEDELYEIYLKDKKKKRIIRKRQSESVRNVKVSTPVQRQIRKKVVDLQFALSPITLDNSGQNSIEQDGHYETFRQHRLKEIQEGEKKLDSTVIRQAKAWIAKHKVEKPSKSFKNSREFKSQPNEVSKHGSAVSNNSFINNSIVLTSSSQKSKLSLPIDNIVEVNGENSLEVPAVDMSSQSIFVPKINVIPPEEISNNDNTNQVEETDEKHQTDEENSENTQKPIKQASKKLRATGGTRSRANKRKLSFASTELNSVSDKIEKALIVEVPKKLPRKSVAINLVPAIKNITLNNIEHDRDGGPNLRSGKWRRSLIAWRLSQNTAGTAMGKQSSIFFETEEATITEKDKEEKETNKCEYLSKFSDFAHFKLKN